MEKRASGHPSLGHADACGVLPVRGHLLSRRRRVLNQFVEPGVVLLQITRIPPLVGAILGACIINPIAGWAAAIIPLRLRTLTCVPRGTGAVPVVITSAPGAIATLGLIILLCVFFLVLCSFPGDILAKLPRNYIDPKYEPHKSFVLRTKWPQWKHFNRAIAEANPHNYSRMMMLFEAAFRPAMEEMLFCFDLPSPLRVPGIADMGWDDLSILVQDLSRELIRQSYAFAMERHSIPKEWDPSCIKQLCHSLFSDQHDYFFEQTVDHLCDAIFRDEDLWTITAGFAPWTNDAIKKLASSGSWYFDLVYYQITAPFKFQTTKKQDLPAPNDQFLMFYDALVDRFPRRQSQLYSQNRLNLLGHLYRLLSSWQQNPSLPGCQGRQFECLRWSGGD